MQIIRGYYRVGYKLNKNSPQRAQPKKGPRRAMDIKGTVSHWVNTTQKKRRPHQGHVIPLNTPRAKRQSKTNQRNHYLQTQSLIQKSHCTPSPDLERAGAPRKLMARQADGFHQRIISRISLRQLMWIDRIGGCPFWNGNIRRDMQKSS